MTEIFFSVENSYNVNFPEGGGGGGEPRFLGGGGGGWGGGGGGGGGGGCSGFQVTEMIVLG